MHEEIKILIDNAKKSGELTENLREMILQKAEQLGEDIDEVDFIIEGEMRKSAVTQRVLEVMPSVNPSQSITKDEKLEPTRRKQLAIKNEGKLILGVCNGLADRFNIDPNSVRLSLLSIEIAIVVLKILHILNLIPFILLLEVPPLLYYYLYYYLTKPKYSHKIDNKHARRRC